MAEIKDIDYKKLMSLIPNDFKEYADLNLFFETLLNIEHDNNGEDFDGTRQGDISLITYEQQNSISRDIDLNSDLDNDFFTSIVKQYFLSPRDWNLTSESGFKDEIENYFWNESVSKALVHFLKHISPDGIKAYENLGGLFVDENGELISDLFYGTIDTASDNKSGVSFRISDLKEADAGKNFCKEDEILSKTITDEITGESGKVYKNVYKISKPWVIPWYNVNGDSYSKVRGDDKIEEVLSDKDNLQFTRRPYYDGNDIDDELFQNIINSNLYKKMSKEERDKLLEEQRKNISKSSSIFKKEEEKLENGEKNKLEKWIRLIMPKYKRFVEIEDLDRNFWVIGQTISAVSAYLFGDNSPIATAMQNLLNEIIQLWENVLYLWADTASLLEKPYYKKIHKEVIYLNKSDIQPYYKYDNFDNNSSIESNEISRKINYLKNTYTDCHLCILPVIRQDNYEENFYATSVYPGVFLYNRNTDKSEFISFGDSKISLLGQIDGIIGKKIYGIKENELTYEYLYPISDNFYTDTEKKFYCLLRENFNISCSFNDSKNEVNLNSVKIELSDAAMQAVDNTYNVIWTFLYNNENYGISFSSNSLDKKDEIEEISIQRGFYQGELLSYYKFTEQPVYLLNTRQINLCPLPKIENDWPDGINNSTDYAEYLVKNDFSEYNKLQLNDSGSLRWYINNKFSSDESNDKNRNIYLIYGSHITGWSTLANSGKTHIYYTPNGEVTLKDFNNNTGAISISAMLYIPSLNIYKTYDKYYNKNDTTRFIGYAYPHMTTKDYDVNLIDNSDIKEIVNSFNSSNINKINIQNIQEIKRDEGNWQIGSGISQTLVMIKEDDDNIKKDNWIVVYISTGIAYNAELFTNLFNDSKRKATGFEKYISGFSILYDSDENGRVIENNDVIAKNWKCKKDGKFYENIENPANLALKKFYQKSQEDTDQNGNGLGTYKYYPLCNIHTQVSVSVFKYDGSFAQCVWIRDVQDIDDNGNYGSNYGRWVVARKTNDINSLRNGYKVISNDQPNKNFEKYKSTLTENIGDDDSTYSVTWKEGVQ